MQELSNICHVLFYALPLSNLFKCKRSWVMFQPSSSMEISCTTRELGLPCVQRKWMRIMNGLPLILISDDLLSASHISSVSRLTDSGCETKAHYLSRTDTINLPDTSSPKLQKTPCKYGLKCYRKNPSHFEEFSHPGDFSLWCCISENMNCIFYL